MRQLSKGKFWIKVAVLFLFNFFICLLLGLILSGKGFSEYFDTIRQKDFINFSIISFLFAFAFNLWLFHDPESKSAKERNKRTLR